MKLSYFVSLTVLSTFLFPSASLAQFVGRGPDLTAPSFVNPNTGNRYQIDGSVECPSTTLNASGFAGNGQDWGTSVPDGAAFSGRDNYGFLIGISIPIGGRMGEFCDQYATLRREFEQKRVESILLRNTAEIFQTCVLLYVDGVDFTDEVFKKEGNLALLATCHELEPVISKMHRLAHDRKEESKKDSPSLTERPAVPQMPQSPRTIEPIEPFEKAPLNVNIINR